MARTIADTLLHIDDRHMDEAEEWVNKAIEVDKRNDKMSELGMAHTLYAQLLNRKGDLPGARETLNKAIEIYKECGADGGLKKAQDDLAAIEKPGRTRAPRKKKGKSIPNHQRPQGGLFSTGTYLFVEKEKCALTATLLDLFHFLFYLFSFPADVMP